MISTIRRSFCVLIGLVMLLTLAGDTAYGQRVVRKKHVVAKHAKKHVKRKIARSRARRKRARRVHTVRTTIPPRDPNRYTVLGTTNVPSYTGPVDAPPDAPPGPPQVRPIPKQISGGLLNGKAFSLPKPAYPPAARAVRASGPVNVQVLIDEEGNVISASAVSGNPLLRASAVRAAMGAKFSPTKLSGQPVKVSGIITYNFVP